MTWESSYDKKIHASQVVMDATANLPAGSVKDQLSSLDTNKLTSSLFSIYLASTPVYYSRDTLWANKGSDTAANRRTLVSPSKLLGNINDYGYVLNASIELDLNTAASWDAISPTDYSTAANRAGKDFYIYACTPVTGTTPVIKLSVNSTIPSGYLATTSRKIGGFHCECLNVGTISSHTLTGYLTGDILPNSVWDLKWKSSADQEGSTLDPNTNSWQMIYLPSVSGNKLVSVFGGVIADGVSSPAFHWYKFSQWLAYSKHKMNDQYRFVSASLGSNQGTNIVGSADPNTTGAHSDTVGRRMISNIGCEDMCGVLWQWGNESDSGGADSLANAYDGNDTGVGGQHYRPANRVFLGSYWGGGAICGSRSSTWDHVPLFMPSSAGCRGFGEHISL